MKSAIICIVLLLGVGALGQTGAKPTQAKSAAKTTKTAASATSADEKLIDAEKSLWQAWKNKDAMPFQTLLDPKGPLLDGDGAQTIGDFMKNQLTGCDVKDFELTDMKVTHLSASTAAVTYHVTQHVTCGNQAAPEHMVSGSIWMKRGAKWIGVFHQDSVASGTMSNMGAMHCDMH